MRTLLKSGPRSDPEFAAATAFRIRSRRESLGLTQGKLATLVGCSRNMICIIEAAASMPGIPMVPALCRALGWTPNELFGWEDA